MERNKASNLHHNRLNSNDVRIIHILLRIAIPVMFFLILNSK